MAKSRWGVLLGHISPGWSQSSSRDEKIGYHRLAQQYQGQALSAKDGSLHFATDFDFLIFFLLVFCLLDGYGMRVQE